VRYIIYGAGAIGSILGGHLHRQGHRVVLVGPVPHVRAINRKGLTLRLPEETLEVPVRAVARARELAPFRADDVVLLCAKSQQTLRCLSQLRRAGAPRTLPIFCCQNSFLNEPQATLFFDRVYGVTVFVDGIYVQPGEAVHPTGRRYGHLEIGRYPSGLDPLARRVSRDLVAAGFSVRANPDVMRTKRAKFVLNMANVIIAITGDRGQAGPLVARLRAEAVRVLRASGLNCEPFAAFRRRALAGCGKLRVPAGVVSDGLIADSTWQSLYRRTGNIETPYFNGVVVHLGRSLGIPTPCNSIAWEIITAMAKRGDRPGKYRAQDLQRLIEARSS
jgi:2-dehydropantoate 2-reductase